MIHKGGKVFFSLSTTDLKNIFQLYDKLLFKKQITTKLRQKNIDLRFSVKKPSNGISGICGEEKCIYYIDINVQSLRTEKIDRIKRLQKILERCIIHLLMLLWDYWIPDKPIFSTTGPLFHCMLSRYFTQKFDERELTSISITYYPTHIGLLKYWENSCYLDSLIMSLLVGASNFYRKNILTADMSQFTYQNLCSIDEKTVAKKVQEQLLLDFHSIFEGKTIYCSNLRKYLTLCLPQLKGRRGYVEYNVSEIYSLLVQLFPSLLIRYSMRIHKKIRSKKIPLFQAWDFISPEQTILWDRITFPILVFQNSLAPAVKNFSDPKSEIVQTWGAIPGKYTKIMRKGKEVIVPKYGEVEILVEKSRVFGEYILNKRYRLFAVLINHGRRPKLNEIGSGHYTAFIRPYFDKYSWYEYNDIGPIMKKEKELPSSVFIDSKKKRPELFLYQKVKKR